MKKTNKTTPQEAGAIDWKALREKFFSECVDVGQDVLFPVRKVNMTPHDLFVWFKKELSVGANLLSASEENYVANGKYLCSNCGYEDEINYHSNICIYCGTVRDYVPSVPSNDEEEKGIIISQTPVLLSSSLASHSCTPTNSIEQIRTILYDCKNTLDTPMKQVIQGIIPSKSNCYRIVKHGQIASLAKTKALVEYEKSFYLQCNFYRGKNIEGLFELHLDVYYPANRADLDNSLKATLDCLQHVKAIKNDNLCTKIVAQKFVDKLKPRIEFEIKEV